MTSTLRRIFNLWQIPKWLYMKSTATFSYQPTDRIQILARLYGIKNELKQRTLAYNLGALYTLPHPFAVHAYASFLDQNPNHLGHWADQPPKEATLQLEYEVIQAMINLYHARGKNLTGYITSGATEGNIFSAWLGKTYLRQYSTPDKMRLLLTSLTHYSIRKSADICNMKRVTVGLNRNTWSIDPFDLEHTARRLYKQGIRGLLIPLTIGYTSIGTSDDVEAISRLTVQLQKKMPGLRIFLWIDAAMQGLVAPFTTDFQPFLHANIQACVVDFHKFGQVPYPAGLIIYKRQLKSLIEQPIEYLQETDATLLGSRPGAPVAAMWSMMHFFGKKGYQQIVDKQMNNKRYFIKQLNGILPQTQILTDEHTLSCGLIFHSFKGSRLPKQIEDRYWFHADTSSIFFHPNQHKKLIIYKCFFLPHMTKKVIINFMNDIQSYVEYSPHSRINKKNI